MPLEKEFLKWFPVMTSYFIFRWILKSLGDDLTEEDIDDMIADVDTDGSGWVDYEGLSPPLFFTYLHPNTHPSPNIL